MLVVLTTRWRTTMYRGFWQLSNISTIKWIGNWRGMGVALTTSRWTTICGDKTRFQHGVSTTILELHILQKSSVLFSVFTKLTIQNHPRFFFDSSIKIFKISIFLIYKISLPRLFSIYKFALPLLFSIYKFALPNFSIWVILGLSIYIDYSKYNYFL